LEFASVPLKNNRTRLLEFCWLCQSVLPLLYFEGREWELRVIDKENSWSLQYQTKPICREGALSEPVRASVGLDLVPLSKIGTHLLASSDIIENNTNSLTRLRNAGSYFAVTYCRRRQ